MNLFLDKHGNEIERTYKDYFRPFTAYQLAQAFPECADLAKKRRRELMKHAIEYRELFAEISSSNMDDDQKYLSCIWIKTVMSLDHAIKELNMLDQYLKFTKDYEPEVTSGELANNKPMPAPDFIRAVDIEKAKSFPLEDLFTPERPRQSSASIMCCCPLHQEKSSSFAIFRKSNRFKCFGCGAAGDPIELYMKLHNVDFRSAVRALS